MRKLIAGSLAAMMILGSTAGVYAEAEETTEVTAEVTADAAAEEAVPAATPKEANISVTVEAQGQNVGFDIGCLTDAAGNAELTSVALNAPAGEEGQTATISAENVLRVIGEDLYLNVDSLKTVYETVTGDTSTLADLSMFGITNSWLHIPALYPVFNEEAVAEFMNAFSSFEGIEDQLNEVSAAVTAAVKMEETETSYIVYVDNDTIINIMEAFDGLINANKDKLQAFLALLTPEKLMGLVNYQATFADYIDAYATGRSNVTGEDVEAIKAELDQMIQTGLSQALAQSGAEMPDPQALISQIPDLSDTIAQSLEGITINGQFEVSKETGNIDGNVDITQGEETINMVVHGEATETGAVSTCVMTQNGQEIASSDCTIEMSDTGFGMVVNAVSGEETFSFECAAAQTETGVDANFTATENDTVVCEGSFNAAQTETGMEGEFSLNVPEQLNVAGNCGLTMGEDGLNGAINATITAADQTVDLSGTLTVPATMDGGEVVLSAAQNGQTLGTITASASVTDAPADTVIETPDTDNTIFDVVRSVTEFYYTMQKAMEEQQAAAAAEEAPAAEAPVEEAPAEDAAAAEDAA